jgi:hypothetical protein
MRMDVVWVSYGWSGVCGAVKGACGGAGGTRARQVPRIAQLLARLDERPAVRATPVPWWEQGDVGYAADGSPVREG